jgi:2-iminobutanoate/2-iminopropanoate deaminase
MPKQVVSIPDGAAPPRGAYSAVLRCGDFVYVSGQSARDENLGIVGKTIEEQTRKTLSNIEKLLASAGASMSDLVKATVHMTDLSEFQRYNTVYAELVPEPQPVRTTVGSTLAPGVLIEIDVVAYTGA